MLALVGRRALEGDALLDGGVAEGVGAPAELQALGPRVVVLETGRRRGRWRGVTRGLLVLLGVRGQTGMTFTRSALSMIVLE